MTLHALTRKYGTSDVAVELGMTERCLVDVRRGKSPLTVDDLYNLMRAYPAFDLPGTIVKIGAIREEKGWSRKQR